MKLCNEREQIKALIKKWIKNKDPFCFPYLDSYSYNPSIRQAIKEKFKAARKIIALNPETATTEDIKQIQKESDYRIFGIPEPKRCDECHKQTWDILDIGNEGDPDRGAYLCRGCLVSALQLLG